MSRLGEEGRERDLVVRGGSSRRGGVERKSRRRRLSRSGSGDGRSHGGRSEEEDEGRSEGEHWKSRDWDEEGRERR